MSEGEDRSELAPDEFHPAWDQAAAYLAGLSMAEMAAHMEAFSSCAIEGNRLAEVCAGTLRRVMDREPVGERYLLGLVLTMRAGGL